MKIGIIGCGNIGSAIARHWVEAGHEVILSARHQEHAEQLAKELGQRASSATVEQAAQDSEVVLLTIPLGQIPSLSNEVREAFKNKIVIDTCNPYPERDGEIALEAIRSGLGMGVWSARQFPEARIVRAFNSVHAPVFKSQAHRKHDPIGVPIASDDADALRVVAGLVRDAGFGPVILGGLTEAKRFDVGTPSYGSDLPVKELREKLGEAQDRAA
jgi:predicted dinucleotide-binding enzyme